MPVTNVLDLVENNYYVLVNREGRAVDVVLSKHTKDRQLIFYTTGGELILVTYPQNCFEDYTCYSEEEADVEFLFDESAILGNNFSMADLNNKVFSKVVRKDDALVFHIDNKTKITLAHEQECCESVYLDDINGDLKDLENTPILEAKETCAYSAEFGTAYFYDIRTIKGSVTLKFAHEHDSNTMYSAKASLRCCGT